MDDDANRRPAGWSAVRGGRRLAGSAYRRADALVDIGQHHAFRFLWFWLPETSVAKQVRFQAVFASRFFSDAGQQALAYGALIAVVRGGGNAFDAALLGVATLIPAAILGLYGGAVADALPKRVALAGVYNLQALLCFTAPSLIGTDLVGLMALLFAVNTLGQVSGPSESSVIPIVATETQLASAASLLSFASSVGAAFGTALLAPVLVRAFGVETVIYVAGAMLLLAASRVFDLAHHESEPQPPEHPRFLVRRVSAMATVRWLAERPAIATMVFVAVVAGTAQIVVQTLAPRYVQAVLQVDAADAVYVFAPSALGLGLAVIATPRLVRARGERFSALIGFVLVATSICCLGLVKELTFVDPLNPLRALSLAGLDLELRLRTAALLALPLGFGLALTSTSVQTYINRRVPLLQQGRTFALQSSLKNGVAIIPLTTLGAAAVEFGAAGVMVASPFVLLALAAALLQLSRRFAGAEPQGTLLEFNSYWEEPAE